MRLKQQPVQIHRVAKFGLRCYGCSLLDLRVSVAIPVISPRRELRHPYFGALLLQFYQLGEGCFVIVFLQYFCEDIEHHIYMAMSNCASSRLFVCATTDSHIRTFIFLSLMTFYLLKSFGLFFSSPKLSLTLIT